MQKTNDLVQQLCKRFNRLPFALVASAGIVVGLGVGIPGFLYLQGPEWALLWGALFAGLWWLGYGAAPVFEQDVQVAAPLRRRRVRDGPIVMMELPGGTFTMGSSDADDMARSNEKPPHSVTVGDFRIAVTPITVGLYQEVMGGERTKNGRLPKVGVSWYDDRDRADRRAGRTAREQVVAAPILPGKTRGFRFLGDWGTTTSSLA